MPIPVDVGVDRRTSAGIRAYFLIGTLLENGPDVVAPHTGHALSMKC
jgi:hypothetical protein